MCIMNQNFFFQIMTVQGNYQAVYIGKNIRISILTFIPQHCKSSGLLRVKTSRDYAVLLYCKPLIRQGLGSMDFPEGEK